MLSESEQKSDTLHFWEFIKKNLRLLIIYSIAGGVLSMVVTFFIPKEYTSSGIIYPPSSTSSDNSIDFPNFGYDVEADRLIQILESREIFDSVVRKFKLDTYHEIDKDNPDWLDRLTKKYYKNVKFERMPSMSILISARTKDPQLSSDIVNFIIYSADALRERIYKKNIIAPYENAKLDFERQKHRVDSAQLVLTEKLKTEQMSSLLMLASDAALSIDIDKLSALKASPSAATLGAEIITFKSMVDLLKEYKTRFIKVKRAFENPIPKLYVINYSEPNFRKVYPSFLTNGALGVLFSLLVVSMLLFIKQQRASF
jgi:hypothetical protein